MAVTGTPTTAGPTTASPTGATAPEAPARAELEAALERHRRELTGYCYRMLGSPFEAEDAVQDTMVRAWRAADRFEGRSSVRTWLYRIATNVCLDHLDGRKRRARPMDVAESRVVEDGIGSPRPESDWVLPAPDGWAAPTGADPADRAVAHESITLAFVAALAHLPPRQRAVLILREVLRWHADEVAALLDTTVASVNSALQRARATLDARGLDAEGAPAGTGPAGAGAIDEAGRDLVARYVDAFERYDLEALTALLHEDATLSMPPYELWLPNAAEVVRWLDGPGRGCAGSRLVPVAASGSPAFGQYRPAASGPGHEPFSLQVIETAGDRVTAINAFLDTDALFPLFGLPPRLD
ncbi:MAG TPA: sigma-70 family RNA polymerase sigma factor [Acidimicrobiales bacterium]|nr:sigma-70 family RNA polymerase sigma factor [Acidimicrobiales bacterium]